MDDNFSSSNQELNNDKTKKNSIIAEIICVLVGLILGGAGVFGLVKLTEKKCPECNCRQVSVSSTELDLDFLKLENENNNIIYSPLSIKYGLPLLSAGANGKTAEEINDVLGDSELPVYQNEADTLSLANAVFIRNEFKNSVLPEYISTVEDKYNSEVIYDNFENTVAMDNWVKQKTFNLIDDVGLQISPDTVMVLANALAIQMDWQNEFDSGDTHGNRFYYDNGEEVYATTMHKETSSENIGYYIDDSVTVLSMPLEKTESGTQLEFDAIMPTDSLGDYIKNLSIKDVESTLSNIKTANTAKNGISISIPKFKFDYELKFKDDLEALGIVSAFVEGKSDFSKMSDKPMYVSGAIHKANIEFSEDGIKAAAVTAFGIDANAMPITDSEQPIPVIINHPFLFVIRDIENGAIWFIGAVYEPNLWENDADSYRY